MVEESFFLFEEEREGGRRRRDWDLGFLRGLLRGEAAEAAATVALVEAAKQDEFAIIEFPLSRLCIDCFDGLIR